MTEMSEDETEVREFMDTYYTCGDPECTATHVTAYTGEPTAVFIEQAQ